MSTLVSQPTPLPPWKQEVNRRLAAHKSRRGLSVVEQEGSAETQNPANSRAAQAAARVAARYAKTPSFSEMQAAEARAALRAAEAATRAALEAQAAAQVALANMQEAEDDLPAETSEAAFDGAPENSVGQSRELKVPQTPPIAVSSVAGQALEIRWDPDLPGRAAASQTVPSRVEAEESEAGENSLWGSATLASASAAHLPIEPVEPALPIHANLIEFPRELVATRRMRPRLTGAQQDQGHEANGQLSIFEVDPSTISIEPEVITASSEAPAPSWSDPEWSGIQLDPQPAENDEPSTVTDVSAPVLQQASIGRRLMAGVVDGALIIGASSGVAAALANHLQNLPNLRTLELGAITLLIAAGVVYHAFFLGVTGTTPGIKYAGIKLCTFDGERPVRAQRFGRVGAMLLSLLPVGVGVVWAIFDDDHLSWHDRLSGTYLHEN